MNSDNNENLTITRMIDARIENKLCKLYDVKTETFRGTFIDYTYGSDPYIFSSNVGTSIQCLFKAHIKHDAAFAIINHCNNLEIHEEIDLTVKLEEENWFGLVINEISQCNSQENSSNQKER